MIKFTLPKHIISYILAILGILILVLGIIGLIGAFIAHSPILTAWRVVFGAILVLFIPGFVWSYVFFPKMCKKGVPSLDGNKESLLFERSSTSYVGRVENPELIEGLHKIDNDKTVGRTEKSLDAIERITLSIALSIALGPLLIFFTNKLGIKIALWSVFIEIFALIFAGFLTLAIIGYREK